MTVLFWFGQSRTRTQKGFGTSVAKNKFFYKKNAVRGLRSEWDPFTINGNGNIQSLRVHQNKTVTFVTVLFWFGQSRHTAACFIELYILGAILHFLYPQSFVSLPTTLHVVNQIANIQIPIQHHANRPMPTHKLPAVQSQQYLRH